MSPRVALALVIALALLAAAAIFWPLVRPAATVVRGDWYAIYFTDPRYPDRPETRRGGIDVHLVTIIDQAQRTLDVAVYNFDLESVASALARAQRRGVAVRLVTDTDTVEQRDERTQRALQQVRAAGIPIVDDRRGPIMHHKFVVADRQIVLTGSWNFSENDTYRHNNNAVRFSSRELAENFTHEFEKMFVERKFGPSKPKGVANRRITIGGAQIETYFAAADDPSERIVELINSAQRRIEFLAFSFTHDPIGNAMMERAKAGVKVRGVFETTGSNTRFSEYGRMREAGLEVYQDGNPYTMHHKVIVIDERITIFGSFNFSENAAKDNDENLLVVHDPGFAQAFLEEVERVMARAKAPLGSRAG